MLLLVTIGLVLVGAVALVIGFVSNSLGPIYLSIACSVIAGIVLVLFSRMARRQESSAPAPSVPSRPSSWGPPATPEPSAPPATRVDIPATPPPPPPVSRPEPSRYEPEPEPTFDFEPEPEPVGATAGFGRSPAPGAMPEDDDFPIPGYDTLRASQILERLPELSLEELDMVREREEQGKSRATIIRRVDLRIDELEAAQDEAAAAAMDEEPALDLEPEFEPEPVEAPVAAASPMGAAMDDDFPIEDYDSLSSDEIIAMLDDLDDDELDMVAAREERGRNRVEILEYIDDMFEEVPLEDAGAATSPAPAPAVTSSRPAAKKATAKKATAKKAAAKKAPAAAPSVARKSAAKKAAPVAKVPLANAPAAKSVAKAAKAPAAGRGAKKAAAAAEASPGTKSAGRRTSAAKTAAKAVPPVAAPSSMAKAVAAAKKATKKAAPARKRP